MKFKNKVGVKDKGSTDEHFCKLYHGNNFFDLVPSKVSFPMWHVQIKFIHDLSQQMYCMGKQGWI